MTKQPSYRFAGYTEPWEQKKLGEVAEVNPKSVVPDEFKYVDLGAVVGTEMVSYRNETISTSPSRAQRLAVKGDVFYQTVRPYQKNNYLFKKDDNDYVFSTGYAQLRPNGDGCFLLSYLQTNKFVNVVLDNCTGTSYPAINSKDLSDIFISIPSLPEQTAIGSFFQDIDQLISLQQGKLEVLKEQKRTYLKLLFPAKGQTKPALRFAGFEDEWTSVLLGDISELYQPKTISSEDLLTEGFPVFGANGYIGYYRDYNHKENQVTISARGEGTGTPSFVEGPVWITGNSMVVNVEKQDNITKPFLYAFCLSFDFKPFVTGGAQPQLTREVLKKVKIMLPSLPEQESIGSFFQDLDKAIAKQEERVNQLKESKQTLLRKMFI
jgi:type I restriction modification DNA specificity domain protein